MNVTCLNFHRWITGTYFRETELKRNDLSHTQYQSLNWLGLTQASNGEAAAAAAAT